MYLQLIGHLIPLTVGELPSWIVALAVHLMRWTDEANGPHGEDDRAMALLGRIVGSPADARRPDLARLWRDTGSSNDPRALLEPILAAIEGGETMRDVRNARALLAELV
jgi:hypothetical protein